MGKAWNDWYHVITHVYGSWLRGDPRGWRARNHNQHCEGDYKNPPTAGAFDRMFDRSKSLMKRPGVKIDRNIRRVVAESFVEKLNDDGIDVIVISVNAQHVHLIGRFPDREPRHWVGRAKKNASHVLRQRGLRSERGGLWGKCSQVRPIGDREHQINAFNYISRHAEEGAVVWTFRDKSETRGEKANG